MKTIVNMKFGSHLYGTDTPQSDLDYKGIYMPSRREVALGRIGKTLKESTSNDSEKNKPGDIDREVFSLHYFIKLACEGQTVAMDMLHAPSNMLLETSDIWADIVFNRDKFYTKNLNAFVGYCRRQAAKYGVKGSRLNDAQMAYDFLLTAGELKLADVWESLPNGEHIYTMQPDPLDRNNNRIYQVCGKKFLESSRASHAAQSLKVFIDEYGARAQLAAENKGIDWKAVSHALRAAYQVEEILLSRTITFPLVNADLIKAVKRGTMDYSTEVSPLLESMMDRIEKLSEECPLPAEVDRTYWDNWLEQVVTAECFT